MQWITTPEDCPIDPLMVSIYGDSYTGRTQLALTAPKPLVLLYTDLNTTRVVRPFMVGTAIGLDDNPHPAISMANYSTAAVGFSPDAIGKAAVATIDNFYSAFLEVLPWAKSIMIDLDSDLWLYYRYKYFGTEKPPGGEGKGSQRDKWAGINGEWRTFLDAWKRAHGPHLILVGKERKEYGKNAEGHDEPTGAMIHAGQPDTYYNCSVQLRTTRTEVIVANTPKSFFKSIIVKSDNNVALCGTVVDNAILPEVLAMIYNTDQENWK